MEREIVTLISLAETGLILAFVLLYLIPGGLTVKHKLGVIGYLFLLSFLTVVWPYQVVVVMTVATIITLIKLPDYFRRR